MIHHDSAPDSSTSRAQSETLGVALLLGIAVVAAVVVVATGYAVLGHDREQVGMAQAERSLSQLDARASAVALGHTNGANLDLGLPDSEGTMTTRPDEGWMRVKYTDLTGLNDPNTQTIANVTMGTVVFQQGSRTVGYQGGGVFRSQGNGSVLVSRPEFHYRNGTLTIPIVKTDGPSAILSRVQITPNGTVRKFPDASRDMQNKVDNTAVDITVHSRYYQAWASFFREYTSGIVTVNPAAETASVQFISLPDRRGVQGGVIATAESGAFELAGTGAYVDSYNSSLGPYNQTATSNGTVKAVGNVTISADATIDGTAESGRWLNVENPSATVTGNGNYTLGYVDKGTIGGSLSEIDGVPTILPIDTLVISRLNELRASNNNSRANAQAGVSNIAGGLEVNQGQSVTIGAGRYYTRHLSVAGGTLVLDTTDGNITLGIEDFLSVSRSGGIGGNVTVVGDGVVNVYLTCRQETQVSITGKGKTDVNLFVGKDSAISVPGNVAPRFRVFAPQTTRAAIAGSQGANATFHGIVYAPDGLSRSGYIYAKQAKIFGGLVGGQITLGQYGQVHYDMNLNDLVLPRASRISHLEFMHVTVHRIHLSSR